LHALLLTGGQCYATRLSMTWWGAHRRGNYTLLLSVVLKELYDHTTHVKDKDYWRNIGIQMSWTSPRTDGICSLSVCTKDFC